MRDYKLQHFVLPAVYVWTGKCNANITLKQQVVRLLLLFVTGMLGWNTHAVQEILSPSEGSEQVRTSLSYLIITQMSQM
jgi:hypothetical protein